MFKTRLHEMCHQRRWAQPRYTISRDGPDHNLRFDATVTVNGFTVATPKSSRSSKEAQNKAAQAAIEQLAAVLPPTPITPPPYSPAEGQVPYKSQLQNLLTRKNVVPTYGYVREGSLHALRFKATVAVDGQTFESPQFYNTLCEAEDAAAKVALLALPQDESHRDDIGSFKNLLQELAQKERISLPIYKTVGDGSSHMPIFSSTVQIKGEFYHGDAAKTKKQAEMNAARVAWCQLIEQKDQKVLTSGILDKNIVRAANADKSNKNDFEAGKSSETVETHNGYTNRSDTSLPKKAPVVNTKIHDHVDCTSSEDGSSSGSILSISGQFAEASLCSLHRNRVIVYPRKSDLVLPEGATVLPFSDDKWVAVSVDFANSEGGTSV